MVGADSRVPSRPLRLAEILASVSLATDLGTGQPPGHALRTCTIAVALAEKVGCSPDEVRTVHQFALLRFLGCTSDAAETAAMVGGDDRAINAAMAPVLMGSGRQMMGRFVRSVAPGQPPLRRLRLVTGALADPKGTERSLSTHCEVAVMLAGRAGLEQPVVDALAHAYERWDGKGYPAKLEGDAIPLAVSVALVARDADLAVMLGDNPREWLRARSGRAYDPAVVEAFERVGADVLSELDGTDEWETALAREPRPVVIVEPAALDAVLTAFADFADLKSPWIRGHSRKVASLAEEAGRLSGLDASECDELRRAGFVHDLGRVAVENGIWDKAGPLTTSEWYGCGCTRTTRSASSTGAAHLRPSSSRRPRTTSASTGPGTTAPSWARRCRGAIESSPRRTCSRPSPSSGPTAPPTATRRLPVRSRRRPTSTVMRSRACWPPPGGDRLPHRRAGRPSSPIGRWKCCA